MQNKVKMNEKWMVKKVPSIWMQLFTKSQKFKYFWAKTKKFTIVWGLFLALVSFRAPCINKLTPSLSHVSVFCNMSICQSKFESWSYKMLPKLEKKNCPKPKTLNCPKPKTLNCPKPKTLNCPTWLEKCKRDIARAGEKDDAMTCPLQCYQL